MREIKYRAKTRMTGEWVYGFYVERRDASYGMIYSFDGLGTKVDKKTVGEFTGLKDKNKILDLCVGDVVKVGSRYGNRIGTIEFGNPQRANETNDVWGFYVVSIADESYISTGIPDNIEIIGNRFDNPELLMEVE